MTLSTSPKVQANQVAALLTATAGVVHLAVVPEHAEHWAVYGLFFAAVGLAQLAVAAMAGWLPGPVPTLTLIGLNTMIINLYVVSRTAGVRIGPHGGPEPTGTLDVATTSVELAAVVVGLAILTGARRRWVGNVLLTMGAAMLVLRATGTLG